MRKTFKSALGYPLTIVPSDGQDIGIETTSSFLYIADKEVPSLMLALGEAAGIVPRNSLHKHGTPEQLETIQWHLTKYVEAQEAIAAQAEETAKLEAEAVELYEMHREIMDYETCMWELLDDVNKRYWLALARKARELGN